MRRVYSLRGGRTSWLDGLNGYRRVIAVTFSLTLSTLSSACLLDWPDLNPGGDAIAFGAANEARDASDDAPQSRDVGATSDRASRDANQPRDFGHVGRDAGGDAAISEDALALTDQSAQPPLDSATSDAPPGIDAQPITDMGLTADTAPPFADSSVAPLADQATVPVPDTGRSALGAPCISGSSCQSGFCSEGSCCENSCDSACMRCDSRETPGYCRPIEQGQTPPAGKSCTRTLEQTCGLDGRCDGTGRCRLWLAGTICRPAQCQGGDKLQPAQLCDGAGTCLAARGRPIDCAPYACHAASGSCFSECLEDEQCASRRRCSDEGRCVAR